MASTLPDYYPSWNLTSIYANQSEEEEYYNNESTCLARQLLFDCWKGDRPSFGTLATGGIGTYYLMLEYAIRIPTLGSRKSRTLICKAREAARSAIDEYSRLSPTSKRKHGKDIATVFGSALFSAKLLEVACQIHLKDRNESEEKLKKLFDVMEKATCTNDNSLWTGRAGTLQALFYIRSQLRNPYYRLDISVKIAKEILRDGSLCSLPLEEPQESLASQLPFQSSVMINGENIDVGNKAHNDQQKHRLQDLKSSPSFSPNGRATNTNERHQFGAARGFIGTVHSLLGLTNTEWNLLQQELPDISLLSLKDSIDEIIQPQKLNWANGLVGLVLLWIKSSQVFSDKNYLIRANHVCETILWPEYIISVKGNELVPIGIAKGSCGIAFLFLQMAVHCEKPLSTLWRRRAEFVIRSTLRLYKTQFAKEDLSLYNGLGGIISLLLQFHQKHAIQMPFYFMGFTNDLRQNDQLERLVLSNQELPQDYDDEDSMEEILRKSPKEAATPSCPTQFWSLQTETTKDVGNRARYRTAPCETPISEILLLNRTPMFSPMAKAETPLPTSKGRVVGQESLIEPFSDNRRVSREVLSQLQTNRLASVESQNGLLPAKTPRKANSTTEAAVSQEQSLMSPKTNLTPSTTRTHQTLIGSSGKVRLTRAAILKLEQSTPTALNSSKTPPTIRAAQSIRSHRRKRVSSSASTPTKGLAVVESSYIKSVKSLHRTDQKDSLSTSAISNKITTPVKTPTTTRTRTSLIGSSGKVPLTRAAVLLLAQKPPTPSLKTPSRPPPIKKVVNTVRTRTSLCSGKVKLTRSAMAKIEKIQEQQVPKKKKASPPPKVRMTKAAMLKIRSINRKTVF